MRQWKLASPWGNLRDGDPADPAAAFVAGRVNDALRLNLPPYNPLLVASDTSGVWLVSESGGPAIPLSWTWTAPHVKCLVRGYYQEDHVFAGGDALYETDVTSAAPLYVWRPIMLTGANDHAVHVGAIHRMVVVKERQALVLATSTGVWWVRIPSTSGGPYIAAQAAGPAGTALPGRSYSRVVEGPDTSVVAACWGTNLTNAYGIFVGDWSGPGGALQFHTRATILGTKERQMLKTELAVCAADRQYLYAVCGGALVKPVLDPNGNPVPDPTTGGDQWESPDDFILAVLRSTDGGFNWEVTGDHVNGQTLPLFPGGPGQDLVGHTQWGHNLCVGVSPFDREIVAVGVVHFVLSRDGGKRWDRYPPHDSAHRHEDTTACYFDPLDPNMLHICSDGGLATTTDLGETWRSLANRQLPNFQFRRFAVSGRDDGLTAGSLQDNGDLFAPLYPNADPWRLLPEHIGGDGILSMFTSSGHLIHHNNTETEPDPVGVTIEYGAKPRACVWDGAKRQFSNLKMFPDFPLSKGVIPLDGTNDGLIRDPRSAYHNVAEVVTFPDWTNAAGELMQAVAAEAEAVFGLFAKTDGTFHWQRLGTVPHEPDIDPATNTEKSYFATASASLDGKRIFVGMNNGRLFRLDEPDWGATSLSDSAISAAITRIAPIAPNDVLIIADASAFRWNGAAWTLLPSGTSTTLPAGNPFNALAVDRSADPPRLFVATTLGVWSSEDGGTTWHPDMIGLPKVPQGWDLRTVIESSGAAFVYLSTFGWSVFRRLTNFEEVVQTVAIVGHMDIVDRQPGGKDIWGHPTFTRIGSLGPLHPLEEYLVTGDNGDEVRVDLKFRVSWRLNRSVQVEWDAKLIDMGSDDEETDHESGVRIVAFKGTETVVIDMDSDEWWPDRAHIEFIIKNF